MSDITVDVIGYDGCDITLEFRERDCMSHLSTRVDASLERLHEIVSAHRSMQCCAPIDLDNCTLTEGLSRITRNACVCDGCAMRIRDWAARMHAYMSSVENAQPDQTLDALAEQLIRDKNPTGPVSSPAATAIPH